MKDQRKTGIIYCRVSSQDQLEGTSLDSQEHLCREFASKQGITVESVFIERGESAKTADRTELKKAIAFCKQKRVAFFVVYKLDRFSRNQEDHVTVRALLRRSCTELRSATEPIDSSPVGRAMEGILSVFAEFDNNVRTERTKQGMLERVKQGVWVWPAPLGYYRPAQGANIAPDPKNAAYIRLAFEEYAKGIYTYKALAQFLAERGFRTGRGKKLYFQTIEKILHNPLYAGIIEAWGQKYQGSFEPVISRDLFERCQPGYEDRSAHAKPRSANNPLFPLRGLVVCPECGEGLTGSSSTNRQGLRYPYYHHRKQGCSLGLSHPKEKFERWFVEYLESITPDPLFEVTFREVVMRVWKDQGTFLRARNEGIQRDIQKLLLERQRVYQYHRAGVYNDEDFEEQKRLIGESIDEKKQLLERGADREFNMEAALDHAFSKMRNPAKTWIELEPKISERLLFQRQIFKERLSFDGKRFGTRNLPLIYQLNLESRGQKSSLVAQVRARWNFVLDELKTWEGLLLN